jgi:hypothetical protein
MQREKTDKVIVKDKWERTGYIPNGKLSLSAEIWYTRNEWKDGNQPIEEELSQIIVTLELKKKKMRDERIEMNRQNKISEEAERIRKELEERKIKRT